MREAAEADVLEDSQGSDEIHQGIDQGQVQELRTTGLQLSS
jgi:hypothetical protein